MQAKPHFVRNPIFCAAVPAGTLPTLGAREQLAAVASPGCGIIKNSSPKEGCGSSMIQYTSRTGSRFSSPSSADEPLIEHLDLLDERHVTIVRQAIAEGRIGYAVQGIHAISDPDWILYGECLPFLIERGGCEHANSAFVPALEVLGEAPVLDRHMLELVLDALETNPLVVLGYHLSADNLSDAETWALVRYQIDARSELAPRLILEIDASSSFADIALANDLLSEVRTSGCRVALDGLGGGGAIDIHSLGLDADIVKVDAPFDLLPDRLSTLALVTGLAARAARVVVVKGIETAEQLETARLAGATHVQGQHVSEPAFPLLGSRDGRE